MRIIALLILAGSLGGCLTEIGPLSARRKTIRSARAMELGLGLMPCSARYRDISCDERLGLLDSRRGPHI